MSEHANVSARGRAPAEDEPSLRDALDAEGADTRQRAALALVDAAGDGLGERTVAALAERARDDPEPDVRQFAVEALGRAGAAEPARDALDDPEEWVRAEAVVALSRAAPGETERLRGLLDADESGWVRRNAVIALGKCDAADQDLLVECIKTDPHPPVREYAAQFLGGAAEDVAEAERILAALLAREPNAFVRAKAAQSLGELGTDRAEEALEAHGVTDSSEDVARTAKLALAEARGVDPDQLDLELPDAPGSGPDRPNDPAVGDFRPRDNGFDQGPGPAPGGGQGFDPRRDLDASMTDR